MKEKDNDGKTCYGCYKELKDCFCDCTRTIFGHPVRYTTLAQYQYKMTLAEFVENIRQCALSWQINLMIIGKVYEKGIKTDRNIIDEKRWPEQWAESLLAWMEIEPKDISEPLIGEFR